MTPEQPEQFEPRPISKFFEIAEQIGELLGYFSDHGDSDRDDSSVKQAREYREEAMKLNWKLESLVRQSVEFALEMNLNADAVRQHLGDYSWMIRHFGDWESAEVRDEWGGYSTKSVWQGPTFDELRENYLALKREPLFLTLLKAEPRQLLPKPPVGEQDTPPNPTTPRPKGVTLLAAALVLQGLTRDGQSDDERRKAAVEMKRRWEKSRPFGRSLPTSIGFDPNDSQAYLYETAALCDCVVKQESMLVTQFGGQKKLVAELRKSEREPLPAG